jgi:hypothetical protein
MVLLQLFFTTTTNNNNMMMILIIISLYLSLIIFFFNNIVSSTTATSTTSRFSINCTYTEYAGCARVDDTNNNNKTTIQHSIYCNPTRFERAVCVSPSSNPAPTITKTTTTNNDNTTLVAIGFTIMSFVLTSNNQNLATAINNNNNQAYITSPVWTPYNILWPIAIKHFNERNGDVVPEFATLKKTSCPIRMKLDMVDDHGLAPFTMRGFLQAKTSPHIVLGPITSDSTIPLATMLGVLDIPEISHGVSINVLNNMNIYPSFTRTCPSVDASSKQLTLALKQFGYRNLGIVYQDEMFSQAWAATLTTDWQDGNDDKQLLQQQHHNVFSLSFSSGTGQELANSVDQTVFAIATSPVNVWFLAGAPAAMEYLLYFARAANKYGILQRNDKLFITSKYTLVLDPTWTDSDKKLIYNFLNGSLSLHWTSSPQPTIPTPGLAALKRLWSTFDVNDINPYLPTQLLHGISYQLPPNYFKVSTVQNLADDVWSYTYDAVALAGIAACRAWAANEDFRQGTILKKYLFNASFTGASGRVHILPNGDRDTSSDTCLLQLALDPQKTGQTLSYVTWGRLSPSNNVTTTNPIWEFASNNIQFRNGEMKPPPDHDIELEDKNYLPSWCLAIGGIEIVAVLILVIWSCVWMQFHQQSEVVMNSQPLFMYIILFGVVTLGMAVIPLMIEESDAACMTFPWLYAIGMTCCLSAVAAKSLRVTLLWHYPGKYHRRKGMWKFYMIGVGIIIIIEIILLIAWTIDAPMIYGRIPITISPLGDVTSSMGLCMFSNVDRGVAYLGSLVCYVAILALGTGIIACRVRDAPEKFQEAKWTALAAASISEVYVVGIPVVAVVYSNPVPRFLVFSAMVTLSAIVISMCLFIPKISNIVHSSQLMSVTNNNNNNVRHSTPQQRRNKTSPNGHNNGDNLRLQDRNHLARRPFVVLGGESTNPPITVREEDVDVPNNNSSKVMTKNFTMRVISQLQTTGAEEGVVVPVFELPPTIHEPSHPTTMEQSRLSEISSSSPAIVLFSASPSPATGNVDNLVLADDIHDKNNIQHTSSLSHDDAGDDCWNITLI